MNWYALHVRSCSEHLVADKVQAAGLEAFYPHRVVKAKDKRHRDTEQKFFPGYVFARFELAHKLPVISIGQVVRILGWRNEAVAIPATEIQSIRIMAESPIVSTPCLFAAHHGDRVRVKWGPLVGMEGQVIRTKRTRVIVSIAALQQARAVEVDADALELLPAAQPAAKVIVMTPAIALPKAA